MMVWDWLIEDDYVTAEIARFPSPLLVMEILQSQAKLHLMNPPEQKGHISDTPAAKLALETNILYVMQMLAVQTREGIISFINKTVVVCLLASVPTATKAMSITFIYALGIFTD